MTMFFVPGEPVPQGSMSVFNGRIVHGNSRAVKAWRATVRDMGIYAGLLPVGGPIAIECVFSLRRGKTVKREHPITRPDLDKLVRCVLDALTGVAYLDDSQVIDLKASKRYGNEGLLVKVGRP